MRICAFVPTPRSLVAVSTEAMNVRQAFLPDLCCLPLFYFLIHCTRIFDEIRPPAAPPSRPKTSGLLITCTTTAVGEERWRPLPRNLRYSKILLASQVHQLHTFRADTEEERWLMLMASFPPQSTSWWSTSLHPVPHHFPCTPERVFTRIERYCRVRVGGQSHYQICPGYFTAFHCGASHRTCCFTCVGAIAGNPFSLARFLIPEPPFFFDARHDHPTT